MKKLDVILRYLVPPHCPLCGETLDVSDVRTLCGACREKWDAVLRETCDKCGAPARRCLCRPGELTRRENVTLLSLYFYHHYDSERLGDRLLFTVKRQDEHPALPFLANELSALLCEHAGTYHLSLRHWVITYPPRSADARREYGFDQAHDLAKAVGKACGMTFLELIARAGGTEQKTSGDRTENAAAAFRRKRNMVIPDVVDGIVLLDDMVTSGATAARCIDLLRAERPHLPVIVLSAAKAQPHTKTENKPADEPWFL